MKCPKCQRENPADYVYCDKCGTPLPSVEEISVSPTKTLEKTADELTRGTIFASRYEVIEELGKGGMGKIYRVEDKKIKEEVALKLIKPEISSDKKTIERFRNELKLARKIAHRNVCKMYDLGEEEGTHYITMEYVPGEDLKSFIRRIGQLPVGKAVSIAKQVCGGLGEAHRLGVVHRDLKPQNIMIDREGNTRIMDFGIARSLQTRGMTGAGVIIGTPDYMSPEQAETKEVDQRSDIYSFGVILFEMLTGRVPFEGETALSLAMKHKSETPPDPKEFNAQVPEDLSRVILRCMEKDKEKRYQETEELLSELTKIEESIPTTEKVVPKRKPSTSKEITVTFNFKKLFVPGLVITVLAIIAVIIWQFIPQREAIPIPSDKPSLAVMYFKNNTGDETLDHWRSALSDLLITDLSQSKYIRVLSAERLFNILRQLNQLEAKAYSSDVLKEVAVQGGVGNILVGNYTRADHTFRINITLQEASTGELVGSESVEGIGEKNFYAMVDELTRKIKENFKFSEKEIATDVDKEVEKITTSSPEAYKYYSEGRKYHLQANYTKSLSFMQKALAIDPEFAMAYRSVAMSYGNMGYQPAKKKAIQKAFELSYRVSDRERFIIVGDYFMTSEKTHDKAIEAYKELLELYPDDSIGNTNLGVVYCELEEWDKALELFKVNLQNAPEALIAYWNLTEVYMAKGLYDIARQVIKSGLDVYPNSSGLSAKLILIYVCQGKYDLAQAELDKAISRIPGAEPFKLKGDIYLLKGDLIKSEQEYQKFKKGSPNSRINLANLYLAQGKFEESIYQLKLKPIFHDSLARTYLKKRNPEEALKEFNKMLGDAVKAESLSEQIRALHYVGLTKLGMKSIEEAQSTADKLKKLIEQGTNKKSIKFYQHLMGMIELERENFPKAINYFKKAISLLYSPLDYRLYHHPLFINSLAQAYYKAGDKEKAREEYERIISLTLSRLQDGDIYAKSFYMLGKIYEEKGSTQKAIEYYEKFLDLWKEADPGIPEVRDVKNRLASLKSQ